MIAPYAAHRRRIVIFSGGPQGEADSIFAEARAIRDEGRVGSLTGRNSLQRPKLRHRGSFARSCESTQGSATNTRSMNWTVYWFMFPACVAISSVAMLSGISGAAMLSPTIILVFPLVGVPSLVPAAAIGMSLFTEFFGFSSGVVGYARRCLIDYDVARQMISFAVPFAAAGSGLSVSRPCAA